MKRFFRFLTRYDFTYHFLGDSCRWLILIIIAIIRIILAMMLFPE